MSDSIGALGAQIAAAEAQLASLRAQVTAGPARPVLGYSGERLAPVAPPAPPAPAGPVRLDLGCGTRKQEGHVGVDAIGFPGVDVVADLANAVWPWADGSVDSVHASHMFEHVPAARRPHFMNELWRALKPGATAQFITPHWASERAVGDPTHEWPPIAPFSLAYFDKQWRATNAPHCLFTCDFTHVAMIAAAPHLNGRNQEFVENAVKTHVNGGHDLHWTLTKRVA